MTTTLYGLQNCDACRKARRWLDAANIVHTFVDVRANGVEPARLSHWIESVGWQTLLNRRSRTWRELSEAQRSGLDAATAATLMQEHSTLIKRPVLESAAGFIIGFSESRYQTELIRD